MSSLLWKKAFSWTRRRNFSTSCLTANSSVRSAMGTKFKHLLRTDFSGSESGKSAGMVITVLLFSRGWLLVILKFLGLDLVQVNEKFRIKFLNFGTNRRN